MRNLIIPLFLFVTACAPFEPSYEVHIMVIDKPVTLSRVIPGEAEPGDEGVPGNLGYFPNTRTPQGGYLHGFVVGAPLETGNRIPVKVVGVHEQVSSDGLISTIIATRDPGETLESIALEKPAVLVVTEAALVKLYGKNARSVGFRSQEIAHKTIATYRDQF